MLKNEESGKNHCKFHNSEYSQFFFQIFRNSQNDGHTWTTSVIRIIGKIKRVEIRTFRIRRRVMIGEVLTGREI